LARSSPVRNGQAIAPRDQNEVAERHQAAPESHRRTIDGADDRDLEREHRAYERLAFVQRRRTNLDVVDHVLQQSEVAPGAEGGARTCEHDSARVGVASEYLPHLGDRPVQLGVSGVERVRPVQRHDANQAVDRDQDCVRVHVLPEAG